MATNFYVTMISICLLVKLVKICKDFPKHYLYGFKRTPKMDFVLTITSHLTGHTKTYKCLLLLLARKLGKRFVPCQTFQNDLIKMSSNNPYSVEQTIFNVLPCADIIKPTRSIIKGTGSPSLK